MFTLVKSQSEAAVKASVIVAEETIKSAWPFTEGNGQADFAMRDLGMLVMCPDKKTSILKCKLKQKHCC